MDVHFMEIKATPSMRIADKANHRVLLVLDIVDGKLVATYDVDDLDRAARMFVDEVLRKFNNDGGA